ncbi:uncharacterized protein DUF4178 [Rhodobacter viridis]|uniref:Uncharacterized protein DUF4178 n=1 Tax=Rhodobacter viridis TaxID=1054202 RepID=A0A318TNV1_9RHOB|nr:DUF4178 domain-containing protein [Rhodobacter viridis]PYF06571.1 uncharacterized protein DUF4178 [Rhodobacter viridis]
MISPEIRVAIRCPNCGAGLDILGGGRITTHICPYCSSALDATENYRLLETYTGMPRAQSPLAIGMEATLDGVSWTIIGVLTQEERDGVEVWTWVDHLLYSPTHGYCWLTLEDRHLILTRRWRKGTSPQFIGAAAVERAEAPPTASADGERFRYYETSTSRIVSIEGEFTWRPRPGDRETAVSLLGSSRMLSFVQTARETEVEMSRYPDQAAVWAAFGITDPPRPADLHPLQPRPDTAQGGDIGTFVKWGSAVFAVLSLALAVVFDLDGGHVVLDQIARTPFALPVPLEATGRRTQLILRAEIEENDWAQLEPALSDPEDQPVFETSREVGIYSGHDADGAWSEGSRFTAISFHPRVSGVYEIALDPPETGYGEAETGVARDIAVQVTVREAQSWPMPAFLLGLAFAALAAALHWRALRGSGVRFDGSDWEDDE